MTSAQELATGWLAPAAVGAAIAATALAPADLQPMAAGMAALAVAAVLGAWAVASGALRSAGRPEVTLALVALVALMGVSTALAVDPRVSALGVFGQHSGWALWAALATAGAALLAVGGGRALSRTTAVGAVAGALLALAGLAERAGLPLTAAAKYSRDPSGLLDNPTSLSQLLVVALACAIAWGLRSRGAVRWTAWAAAALCAAGVLAANVTGGMVAAAAGAVLAFALVRVRPRTRRASAVAAALVVVGLLAVLAATFGVSAYAGDSASRARLDALSSERTTIWRAAFARVAARPVLGVGPDQFGVVRDWTGSAEGALEIHSTSDPHSSVLALLLDGGVAGLLAGLCAAFAVSFAVLEAHRVRGLPPAAAVLVGGGAAWLVSTLVAWVYAPAALLALATLLPIAAGAPPAGDPEAGGRTAARLALAGAVSAGVLAAACAGLLAWWAVSAAPIEARTASAAASTDIDGLVRDAGAWPDPVLVSKALAAATPAAGAAPDAVAALADAAAAPASYHSDAAFRRVTAYQAVGAAAGRDTYAAFSGACASGRLADPRSGIWDYALVLESLRLGRKADAAKAAQAALAFPQSAENATWLAGVKAGTAGLKLK